MGWFNKQKKTPPTLEEDYQTFVTEYHKMAKEQGYANSGIVSVPALMPCGERVIASFLNDEELKSMYSSNSSASYFYAILWMSILSGMAFADKWYNDGEIGDEFVEEMIEHTPVRKMSETLFPKIGIRDMNKQKDFCVHILGVWTGLSAKRKNEFVANNQSREYWLQEMLAAYQLGVSMMLDTYGY